jgi:hypothetical protein
MFIAVQGSYAYIESSASRVQGEIARLKSPQFSSKTTICLSLWYYMYGDGIGDLTILLKKVYCLTVVLTIDALNYKYLS